MTERPWRSVRCEPRLEPRAKSSSRNTWSRVAMTRPRQAPPSKSRAGVSASDKVDFVEGDEIADGARVVLTGGGRERVPPCNVLEAGDQDRKAKRVEA